MKAPDKLYVAESRKIIGDIEHNVFSEQPFLRGSIEYIRKDLLLEWAKKELETRRNTGDDYYLPAIVVLNDLIEKINSL